MENNANKEFKLALLSTSSFSSISLKFLNFGLLILAKDELGVELEVNGVSELCGVLGEPLTRFSNVVVLLSCHVLC